MIEVCQEAADVFDNTEFKATRRPCNSKRKPLSDENQYRCGLTWLEYQRSSYLNIPAITRRLYTL